MAALKCMGVQFSCFENPLLMKGKSPQIYIQLERIIQNLQLAKVGQILFPLLSLK